MTNEEVKNILEKIQTFFDSSIFENNQEIMEALDIAIEAVSKKEELTETAEFNQTPFDRVENREDYYFIDGLDHIYRNIEIEDEYNNGYYECSNYFNDKNFAKQVALHQLLYRKLLKFKLQRDKTDPLTNAEYYFFIEMKDGELYVKCEHIGEKCFSRIYFNSINIAEQARIEVILPFLKEHPDFIWNW